MKMKIMKGVGILLNRAGGRKSRKVTLPMGGGYKWGPGGIAPCFGFQSAAPDAPEVKLYRYRILIIFAAFAFLAFSFLG